MFSGIHRLALKHVTAILVVIAFFTTIILLFQTHVLYRQELDAREQTLESIESSYLSPTAAAVFFFEDYQLQLLAEGMLQLPFIDAVTISEYVAGDYLPLISTNTDPQGEEMFEFPLVYMYEGDARHIGKITVNAGLHHIWPRIRENLRDTALFSILIMVGIAVIVLWIAHRMLFRHLTQIAAFAHSISPENMAKKLSLHRRPATSTDELDVIVGALNTMLDRLKTELLTSSGLNTLLNAIIDSPQDIRVFALDTHCRYLAYTASHQTDMRQIWNASIAKGTERLSCIADDAKRLQFQENFRRSLNGEAFTEEEENFGHDTTGSVYEHRYNPLCNTDGEIIGVTVFTIDITHRKQMEVYLERQLAEKERLIQELFHRTNNNMQVIQGLLNYYASEYPDQSFAQVAESIMQQIQSMAFAHQQLYKYSDLSRLPLRQYIVSIFENVLEHGAKTHANLRVAYDIDEIFILLDSGVPLGLAVTLLIQKFLSSVPNQSHSQDDCKLHFSAHQSTSGDIEIVISSDGSACEKRSASDMVGSEVELAVSIVESQLNGTLVIPDENAPICIIRFSDNRYQERVQMP